MFFDNYSPLFEVKEEHIKDSPDDQISSASDAIPDFTSLTKFQKTAPHVRLALDYAEQGDFTKLNSVVHEINSDHTELCYQLLYWAIFHYNQSQKTKDRYSSSQWASLIRYLITQKIEVFRHLDLEVSALFEYEKFDLRKLHEECPDPKLKAKIVEIFHLSLKKEDRDKKSKAELEYEKVVLDLKTLTTPAVGLLTQQLMARKKTVTASRPPSSTPTSFEEPEFESSISRTDSKIKLSPLQNLQTVIDHLNKRLMDEYLLSATTGKNILKNYKQLIRQCRYTVISSLITLCKKPTTLKDFIKLVKLALGQNAWFMHANGSVNNPFDEISRFPHNILSYNFRKLSSTSDSCVELLDTLNKLFYKKLPLNLDPQFYGGIILGKEDISAEIQKILTNFGRNGWLEFRTRSNIKLDNQPSDLTSQLSKITSASDQEKLATEIYEQVLSKVRNRPKHNLETAGEKKLYQALGDYAETSVKIKKFDYSLKVQLLTIESLEGSERNGAIAELNRVICRFIQSWKEGSITSIQYQTIAEILNPLSAKFPTIRNELVISRFLQNNQLNTENLKLDCIEKLFEEQEQLNKDKDPAIIASNLILEIRKGCHNIDDSKSKSRQAIDAYREKDPSSDKYPEIEALASLLKTNSEDQDALSLNSALILQKFQKLATEIPKYKTFFKAHSNLALCLRQMLIESCPDHFYKSFSLAIGIERYKSFNDSLVSIINFIASIFKVEKHVVLDNTVVITVDKAGIIEIQGLKDRRRPIPDTSALPSRHSTSKTHRPDLWTSKPVESRDRTSSEEEKDSKRYFTPSTS